MKKHTLLGTLEKVLNQKQDEIVEELKAGSKSCSINPLASGDLELKAKHISLDADGTFLNKMRTYLEEKGGHCVHEGLAVGGLKLYVTGVSEKLLREVVLPYVRLEAAEFEWTVKFDEGPLVVDEHGTVKWSEMVIA